MFGILVGLAGIEHGIFEILQGDVKPDARTHKFRSARGPIHKNTGRILAILSHRRKTTVTYSLTQEDMVTIQKPMIRT